MFSLRLRALFAAVMILSLLSGLTPFEPLSLVQAEKADAQTAQDPQGRYELRSQRGIYSKTYQEPDGKLTTEISTMPLHFKDASEEWQEIDNTLVADGTGFTNAASGMDIDFAGQASETDIIDVGYEQHSLGLGLLGAADVEPIVDGSSITYPDVLPGADLQFDIYGESIKESLIFKRTPKLPGKDLELRFPLKTRNLAASVVNGEIVLRDASGAVQLTIPEMFMFDSAGSGAAAEPARSPISFTLENTGNAQHIKALVDGAWLNDPARIYPVTIDPSITGRNPNLDTFVQSNLSSAQNLSSSLSSGTPDGGVTKARALVRFDLNDIPAGSTISSATLSMWENHSFSCTNSPVDVYRVDTTWNSSVTWANKPTFASSPADSKSVAKGFSSACAAGWVDFNVLSPIQYIKNSSATNEGFGIRATDETVNQQWKKFASAEGGNPPKLSVTYQTTPDVPVLSSPANGATNVSQLPSLKATFKDQNPNDQGHVNFQLWLASQCSGSTQSTCSGTPITWAAGSTGLPNSISTLNLTNALTETTTYKWTGRGYDGNSYGPWANLWSFTTADDLTAPAAPVASSQTHPTEGTWYSTRDVQLKWTEPYDVSGIKGYSSIWDTSPTTEPPTTSAITGTVSLWYGVADGTHWLHVKAQDKANPGNWSSTEHFKVNVDGTPSQPPVISSADTHPDETVTYSNDDPKFDWTVPSDLSGINGYSYVLDQSQSTVPDTTPEGTTTTKSYADIADGTHWFHVRARDLAGNWSDPDHFKVSVLVPAPHVVPELTGPAGQTTSNGTPAIKDGDQIQISGSITAGTGGGPDSQATVTKCDLVVLDAGLTEVKRVAIPSTNCKNVGGTLQGNYTVSALGTLRGSAHLEVEIQRAKAGTTLSSGVQESEGIVVDNDTPALTEALMGCDPEFPGDCWAESTIRLSLGEPVRGDFIPADFSIAGNSVISVDSTCTTSVFCNELTLTTSTDMEVTSLPQVTYSFSGMPNARPRDPSGHLLPQRTLQIRSGFQVDPVDAEPLPTNPFPDFMVESENPAADQVLILDANVMQAYSTPSNPTYEANCNAAGAKKNCGAPEREMAFARRVAFLSGNPLNGDPRVVTTNGLPDILLLQEVRCDDIANILYRLKAHYFWSHPDYKRAACRQNPVIGDPHDKNPGGVIKNDTGIVYNDERLNFIQADSFPTKYTAEQARDCDSAQFQMYMDTDLDGTNDCSIMWKRHFRALFEVEATGKRIAVASVHFATPEHLKEDNAVVEGLMAEWATAAAKSLSKFEADAYAIGGDFNARRCATAPTTDLPEPQLSEDCKERAWWTALTAPTTGLTDAIFQMHGDPAAGRSQDDLTGQFFHGCESMLTYSVATKTCARYLRTKKRIDHIFALSGSVLQSSMDVNCGVDDPSPDLGDNDEPHCQTEGWPDNLDNPRRYSDHRLLWTLLDTTP